MEKITKQKKMKQTRVLSNVNESLSNVFSIYGFKVSYDTIEEHDALISKLKKYLGDDNSDYLIEEEEDVVVALMGAISEKFFISDVRVRTITSEEDQKIGSAFFYCTIRKEKKDLPLPQNEKAVKINRKETPDCLLSLGLKDFAKALGVEPSFSWYKLTLKEFDDISLEETQDDEDDISLEEAQDDEDDDEDDEEAQEENDEEENDEE